MSTGAILLEERVDERILIARLNRPVQANAIDWDMAQALSALAQRLENSPQIDALVIAGEGRIFCGGGDVALFRSALGEGGLSKLLDELAGQVHTAWLRLVNAGPLLVAAVNGPAAGAGLGLICACDIAYARPGATLRAGFSKLGLSPDSGTTYFLPRIVGHRAAVEILLCGAAVSAQRALALGIYQELIESTDNAFLDEVLTRTRALIACGAAARETRTLLRSSAQSSLEQQLVRERESIVRLAGEGRQLEYIRKSLM